MKAMKLAVNFSPQAAALASEGRIEIDFFKAPPWPDLTWPASAVRPVHIHSEVASVALAPVAEKVEAAAAWIPSEGTRNMNTHLVVLEGEEDDIQSAAEFGIAHVRALRAMTSAPVIVENTVPACIAGGNRRAGVEPETFHRILKLTGAGMLLDIAHARLTCLGFGLEPREYISALPLSLVQELHVTGVQQVEGRWRDSMPMTEEDWELTEWAIREALPAAGAEPWFCALEYGGVGPKFDWRSEPEVLARDVPRLARLMR